MSNPNNKPHPKAANLPTGPKRSRCSACNLLIKKGESGTQVDGHWFHRDTCLRQLRSGKPIVSRSGKVMPKISGGCGPSCPHCGGKNFKFVGFAAVFKQLPE